MTWIACPRRHRAPLRRRALAAGALPPLSWLPSRAWRRPASLTLIVDASAGGPMTPPAPPPCPTRAHFARYALLTHASGQGRLRPAHCGGRVRRRRPGAQAAAGAARRRAQGRLVTAPFPGTAEPPLHCARAAAPGRASRVPLPLFVLLRVPFMAGKRAAAGCGNGRQGHMPASCGPMCAAAPHLRRERRRCPLRAPPAGAHRARDWGRRRNVGSRRGNRPSTRMPPTPPAPGRRRAAPRASRAPSTAPACSLFPSRLRCRMQDCGGRPCRRALSPALSAPPALNLPVLRRRIGCPFPHSPSRDAGTALAAIGGGTSA